MELVSFVYDKKNGESPRRRFIAVKQSDTSTIQGVDLSDKVFKTFSRSKMSSIQQHNAISELLLSNAILYTRENIFLNLGYGSAEQAIVKQLKVTDAQLASLVSTKLGVHVEHLADGYFLQVSEKELVVTLTINGKNFEMYIRENEVIISQFKKALTTKQFIQQVLS